MSLRRVGVLFAKEIIQGPKNYLVIMALGMPLLLSLILTLVFGTYFSGKSRLGLVDLESSALPGLARENSALDVRTFRSEPELRDAVARGAIDIGLVLPAAFDQHVRDSQSIRVPVYVWGESQLQHRIVLSAAITRLVRDIAGQEPPVEISETVLGRGANIPWQQRLLPLLVLMTILLGGTVVPSTSLVTEKTKRTLTALGVTPATLGEIFVAKGLLGVTVSMISALLLLSLNRAFGSQPLLLVLALLLGSIFGTLIGILVGALVKDINTLFTTVKGLGILLYGPAFIYMFPELPQWIARFFPTYYVIQPVLQISQENASLREVAPDLAILVVLILFTMALIARLAVRTREAQAAA